jgi:hypothetical protein
MSGFSDDNHVWAPQGAIQLRVTHVSIVPTRVVLGAVPRWQVAAEVEEPPQPCLFVDLDPARGAL